MNARPGFALLAVLWIIVSLAVVVALIGQHSQRAMALTEAMHARTVGRWDAEGCLARWQSVVNAALAVEPTRAMSVWRTLDRGTVDSAVALSGCELRMRVDGRVMLDRAADSVLAALPGMTPEAIARVLEMRTRGDGQVDLMLLESSLSPQAKAIMDAHFAELTRLVAPEPDVWVVRAQAHHGTPPTPMNIEVRFVRGGTRAAIVRWVEW